MYRYNSTFRNGNTDRERTHSHEPANNTIKSSSAAAEPTPLINKTTRLFISQIAEENFRVNITGQLLGTAPSILHRMASATVRNVRFPLHATLGTTAHWACACV